MPGLKDIRLRIKSVQTTQQTTRAMKMVAASKLRRAQDAILQFRPYAQKLNELQGRLVASAGGDEASPYAQVRNVQSVLFVVLTSNRGRCGAFNSSIIKIAHAAAETRHAELYRRSAVKFLCLGKKGYDYFKKHGLPVVSDHYDVFSKLSFETVEPVAQRVLQGFLDGEWDKVVLFYNAFKNVAVQIRTEETLLPAAAEASPDLAPRDYIYEPARTEILRSLVPKILKTRFYRAVLESNASEHGARMFAMDQATENAETLLKELRLNFNKARQAAITKEILEIVGGAEALSS
ncbi:MAG: ATP synthase F1 subunit gamma [Bacteroidia bacterium]|nr:ATP synthase F1 subunit gamma [Bacteroidia bacterium]